MTRMYTWFPLLLLLLVSGCNSGGTTDAHPDSAYADSIVSDISADALRWADSVMRTMSLEEQAGQLIMPAVYSDSSARAVRQLRRYVCDWHVGGIVLLKGDIHSAAAVVDTLQKMSHPAMFIAIDAEWGLAMRLEGAPEFPRNGFLAGRADDIAAYDYGNEVARECRLIGINMVLGPVIDVAERGSVIGNRSFSSDPQEVARLGIAYSRGLTDGGVIAVAKHFPGHGSAAGDSHKRVAALYRSREALDSIDLLPFREFVKSSFPAIMVGHIAAFAIDSTGIPAAVSGKVITDLLKQEMEFKGLIITDAMTMEGAGKTSAADALIAGADIVLAPPSTDNAVKSIIEAVESGRISQPELSSKVTKVLYYKFLTGLYESGKVIRGNDLDIRMNAFDRNDLLRRLTGVRGRNS